MFLVEWDTGPKRLCGVTDCKPLACVLNGAAKVTDPATPPVFDRMAKSLFRIVVVGWQPCKNSSNITSWRKRELNLEADLFANFTMDTGESWVRLFYPPCRLNVDNANLLVHTDGGSRVPDGAAGAWICEVYVVTPTSAWQFPLVMGGIFIVQGCSAFQAETLAMARSFLERPFDRPSTIRSKP